eukprot:3106923-Karenia_brevis.AAC.1
MPNPAASPQQEPASPAAAAADSESARSSTQPNNAPMTEPEPPVPEYIWRCYVCNEQYEEEDLLRD